MNNYGLSEFDHVEDREPSWPDSEIGPDLTERRGRARRYAFTFWHGKSRRHADACRRRGRVPVVLENVPLFVCRCKVAATGPDDHTCGKYRSDKEWLVVALNRYIGRDAELLLPSA
jgi:hypothetical protein